MFDRVEDAASRVQVLSGRLPETAIVLGSGLGDFAETLRDPIAFPYTELPHWPASNVVGHAGRLVIGNVAGKRVAALAGRAHFDCEARQSPVGIACRDHKAIGSP